MKSHIDCFCRGKYLHLNQDQTHMHLNKNINKDLQSGTNIHANKMSKLLLLYCNIPLQCYIELDRYCAQMSNQ